MAKSSAMVKALISASMGKEPDLSVDNDRLAIVKAYNWYNYACDSEQAKEFAIDYLKSISWDKEKIRQLQKVDEKQFINSIGWNCRILSLGGVLPLDYIDRMYKNIDKLLSNQDKKESDTATSNVIVLSVQSRVKDKTSEVIGNLEIEYDNFINDSNYQFSAYDYLTKNSISPAIARSVAEYYQPLFDQYQSIIDGEDAGLAEGYRGVSKKSLNKRLEFIGSIIDDANRHAKNLKQSKPRKIRTKKAKSAIQQTAKIKFKESDDKYKLKSIRVTDIVGADTLWVFNTKYRTLGVYRSQSINGLSMKGTTIQNFDEKASIAKKLRKPEDILPLILEGSKVAARKTFDAIKSKNKTLTGRINDDIVILRAIK
jgi:hypothetical protein